MSEKQEANYTQWGGFGDLVFKGRLSPSAVSDSRQWRVNAANVINGYPRHQMMGEAERVMNLEIKFSNKFCDITKSVKALDDMAASQSPRALVIGNQVYGQFVIKNRTESGIKTTPSGTITAIIYQAQIVEVRE